MGTDAGSKSGGHSRFLSIWVVAGAFAAAVSLAVCGGCGASSSRTSTAGSSTPRAIASTNYTTHGAWLGQAVTGDAGSVCGYGRYAVWSVHERQMTCPAAARLIDAYLAHGLHAPPGWRAAFRRDKFPPGGPQGSRAVKGMFELISSSDPASGVAAGLSAGQKAAPPPLI